MLGMYTTSNEPTDETKAAAEKLLNYLREQRVVENKVSIDIHLVASVV